MTIRIQKKKQYTVCMHISFYLSSIINAPDVRICVHHGLESDTALTILW